VSPTVEPPADDNDDDDNDDNNDNNGGTIYRSFVTEVAPTHKAGQSFQCLSFDGERAVVNKGWAAKCEPHPTPL
jgi:hypothetical protein